MDSDATQDASETSGPESWIRLLFPAMVAGRVFGAAISPLLFAHFPLGLILLSPFLIHLVAVAPLVDGTLYFGVALVVTSCQALIGFWFGHLLGTKALVWLLERVPIPPSWMEAGLNLVRKASVVALLGVPGPVMGTVAGVAGVKPKLFHLLVVPAQAMWVAAAYWVGDALLEWIEIARGFVIEHAFQLTALTAGIMVLRLGYAFWMKRRARRAAREIT